MLNPLCFTETNRSPSVAITMYLLSRMQNCQENFVETDSLPVHGDAGASLTKVMPDPPIPTRS